MHEHLRSIGFSSYKSKKQLKDLIDWVLEKPDHLTVQSLDLESNLTVAERDVCSGVGIAVVGEMSERGTVVPEHYFPYVTSTHISSDSKVDYEWEHTKSGYIGICEDKRMGMSLIFSVKNIAEVSEKEGNYSKVNLSALALDGMVLLPIVQTEKDIQRVQEREEHMNQLYREAAEGNTKSMEEVTREEVARMQRIMERLHETDVYTVVDNFFMPYGMESDQYYFMGKIATVQRLENPMTGEHFYRMLVDCNGMPVMVAINEADLQGMPDVGCRLKCHAWLTGELKR